MATVSVGNQGDVLEEQPELKVEPHWPCTHPAAPGLIEEDQVEDISDNSEQDDMKARVREMNEEVAKLKELQKELRKQMNMSSSPHTVTMSMADARSIYVGNVDYGATPKELEEHFKDCGSVNRVTILCDKFSGHPKGFAYIEFSDIESVSTSLALDQSLFRGRLIKVIPKRTNRPGISTTDRGFPRSRSRGRTTNYSSHVYAGFNRVTQSWRSGRGQVYRGRVYRGRVYRGQVNAALLILNGCLFNVELFSLAVLKLGPRLSHQEETSLSLIKKKQVQPEWESQQVYQMQSGLIVLKDGGKPESMGGTEDHKKNLESETMELEELLMEVEAEPELPRKEELSQPAIHPGAPELKEGDPEEGSIDNRELEDIKVQVRDLEEIAAKLTEMQLELQHQDSPPSNKVPVTTSMENMNTDARSIYVGNVDYGATSKEVEEHFKDCGSVNRVTILCDKFSGHPKGFAYIEFSDKESVSTSLTLDQSLFRGRLIKVIPKRTNRPGISTTDRGFPRSRYCGRTTNYSSYPPFQGGFNSGTWGRGRGRVYRGRVRATSWYPPY
ncbi:PREDICTED: uncharacterized protein LOC102820075 [Chrysochloris asiatica]|uniref:Polyadenylate-binding protein 2 n=1 Tax=Chrysochloris asiatica TaxID=185453 RepID=A0A9B0X011_CHRAS|nr:PREDICTED: uncharacterized protein LOC102820075 [Chrysochloris asiatica]